MCIKSYLFLAVPFMMAIFVGCRSTSVHTIPDAPPPYPSFPVPQERYNSAQVYGGQTSNVPYVPPYSSPPTATKVSPPSFYTPPPASPPSQHSFAQQPAFSPNQSQTSYPGINKKNNSASARFTLEAKADLWALVQDAQGVELEWLKMKTGESASLYHSGELTITCSSGNKLIIKDKNQKPINTNPNSSGISIVRLPAI
jgi:hypothetical protein